MVGQRKRKKRLEGEVVREGERGERYLYLAVCSDGLGM